jgi:hypothetical protein
MWKIVHNRKPHADWHDVNQNQAYFSFSSRTTVLITSNNAQQAAIFFVVFIHNKQQQVKNWAIRKSVLCNKVF